MRTRPGHWTRRSGGTLKRGAAARGEAAGPKAQGRAVSSRMPEWGLVAGSPDRCSRGRERIPNSILDGEKLWKGEPERRKQRTRASVRVGARSACGGAAARVARVSVTRGVAAGRYAGAGGSPQLEAAQIDRSWERKGLCERAGFIQNQNTETIHSTDRPVSVRKWNGIGNGLMRAGPPPVGPVRSTPEPSQSGHGAGHRPDRARGPPRRLQSRPLQT
jgi:hypothetical protein